jgi:hypothetical protein
VPGASQILESKGRYFDLALRANRGRTDRNDRESIDL